MEFSQKLYQAAKPIINDIYEDDFIQKMLLGNIQADALRHYLQADAAYLKEFTNLYALLIPKMNSMNDVKFLVEQIEFMVEGEVLAHDILAQIVGESYEEIIKQKFGLQVATITENICISKRIVVKMLFIQLLQWHLVHIFMQN